MKKTVTLNIKNLDCPDCASRLENNISGLNEVNSCRLDFTTSTAKVSYDTNAVSYTHLTLPTN